jgi:chromosome segregation ATPase
LQDAKTGVDAIEREVSERAVESTATLEANQAGRDGQATTVRRQLNEAIEELKRTKRALERNKSALRDLREELSIVKNDCEERQGEVDDLTERLQEATRIQEQYRNWWINEVQFTKLILSKVPNANEDWDLMRTSQSHYLGRF